MALALSVPFALPGREEIVTLGFGAVLFSLVGQGLSLPWLVKRLKLSNFSGSRQQIEQWQAQLMTAKAAQDELDSLLKSGVLPKAVYEFDNKSSELTKLDTVRRRLLLAEKGALNEAMRKRILSETIVRSRLQTIDEQLLRLEDD